ncbi:MAG: Trk system potassium transporter TrkA [Chitinivibrionales bacterium]|nr:Trk system potassium transporter TrkA [Chitinivibrionales bacterium]MBD3358899.1 Trk system potassium transporter TrkA [Chitinivibrionales bacterium]
MLDEGMESRKQPRSTLLNIIIVGAGTVGLSLAEHLKARGDSIAIVEQDPELASSLSSRLDAFTVAGVGASPNALLDAGIRKADMVIAVTPRDDTNLVVCNFAKQLGVRKRIARISSTEYTDPHAAVSLKEMGVTHVIEPEEELVRKVMQYLELPGVTESANFQFENVYLRGYRITADMPVANRSLPELNELTGPSPMLAVLIIRDGKSVLPTGSERILPGDELIMVMPSESLPAFRRMVNQPTGKLRKVVISGDSLTAILLARAVRKLCERVILVDPDPKHGEMAAAELDGVEVLEGDCTNVQVLQDIQVKGAAFFIAAGKDSEDNVMSCLLAKAEGAREVIAISNTDRHIELFHSLGLDRIISPRQITAQTIINNIIKVPIGALLKLKNVDVEVVRFVAERDSRIVDKPLRSVEGLSRKSVIIGAAVRGDEVIIPGGNTIIRPGDEVLVFCQPRNSNWVRKLFKAKLIPSAPSEGRE